ncbi:aminotransferase class V-fold PLP-dependent enzyme [Bacillus sp. FJAT-45350]|uniref:aminotransferase class V-fold PLP-dependent enzyme n=1 Tax=Bacillus sp. FJAT-45350 TaxID=2011014 RepID=UPI000BB6F462|nr:aminotransferase class V-fold PLP-dependent enzyme [Bacillus sp. FJAT-45350]
MEYIYLDQAASSFPKPKKVAEAMTEAVLKYGANPGRGGHQLAQKADEVIYQTRVKLAKMFGAKHPNEVIFYQNATMALNQAIKGITFKEGEHVITTEFEHNSVRRPLEAIKKEKNISITYVKPNENWLISVEKIEEAIQENTKAIIVSHGSNVTGAIAPLTEIGQLAKKNGILLIVDASQTAGVLPIDMEKYGVDLLAFAGHKGLLGPQGTGALIVRESIELVPLMHGGTGSHSESVEQPEQRPARFESGTLNTPGIAGLSAGIDEVKRIGINEIFEHEWKLTKTCIERLQKLSGVTVYGPLKEVRLGVIPFAIEGIDAQEVAMILDEHYKIAVRAGLHCSPMSHQAIGTLESGGTIRVSFGPYNTEEDVDRFVVAIEEITSAFI